ncbi:MAG: type II toxin-antitoxin system VapC family toxin [Spirochaetales bacterium]|nr:type II toxin-antitoxin system VapC family toxin [Spirochaetales bacterium]
MENNLYVLDANVFLEYIFGRPLKNFSQQLIKNAILNRIKIIVPSLLLDEITEVLCGNLDNVEEIQKHLKYIEHLAKEGAINIIVPNSNVRMKAIEIARTGNRKSGYPELTDSLYHALAILNGAVFVTNDSKHISKVEQFEHIWRLSDISLDII